MQPDKDLERLEKQFVCVRIIKTNGLDLNLFQYDYDQSWAAMFMNADKVIYGRYGTRVTNGPRSDSHISLASFKKAMERALELHRNYPGNKALLAGNIGKAPEWRYPEQIPGLQERGKRPVTRKTCIHCHMVRDHQLRAKWEQKRLSTSDLYVYPMPDNIGMKIDVDDGLLIKAVEEGSFADKAGVSAGDRIDKLNDQSVISLADIQWVLHNIPEKTQLPITLQRDGKTLEKTIPLSGKWKQSDIGWRASSWYGLRQGLKLEPLSAPAKKERGIPADKMALVVKNMFGQGPAELRKAGLRVRDVIVAVDGKDAPMSEMDCIVYLRLTHGPGESASFTVLRGNKRQTLKFRMW